ncbi:ATP-dependent DNA helicase RecG [Corynebacterium renale]|uniref:ATP-dependent DNA helicase RecG n=1 Tax=Corynebacterium renale TaxID=1724 RepID=A0A2A9DQF1_9CORY|nr:ATP-dependent DNA helicase RecG [Corynebacterium renale]PFG28823.1 ATP-dependent DNA helicase RecG [Corynebacterium renale]SQI25689.1 ATP-dependent DNA helicase recG [Corynebacterium renale]
MLGWHDRRTLDTLFEKKTATEIRKELGLSTVDELLAYRPRTYSRNGAHVGVGNAEEGEQVTIVGEVLDVRQSTTRNGMRITTVTIFDGTVNLTASFFRVTFIAKVLLPGTKAMFTGKVRYYRGQPQLQHPQYVILRRASKETLASFGEETDEQPTELELRLAKRDYVPIYPATKKATSWKIMDWVDHVLANVPPIPEPLDEPPAFLPSFDQAIRGVHVPGPEGPEPHIERLKYNEALELATVMALRRADNHDRVAAANPPRHGGMREGLLGSLPYELTAGQQEVVETISHDLSQEHPMSRLLQGEVGSGKTVVALLSMLQVIDNGRQCAFMAPTEVLATQHWASLQSLCMDLPLTVVLLTGSLSTQDRQDALLKIVSGQADIVVGTHALFQDSVDFFDLGLVVVDEQHRFGVEQRDDLRAKGGHPHLLVMTATPIPRTIAMTVFGDLAISSLRELPGGRKPIQSFVVHKGRPAWWERTWSRLYEEVEDGHQGYVVCPSIEGEGGVLELANVLRARWPNLRIEELHGKLHPEDKDYVMAEFAAGRIDVLVATTVIEVGVDVANATVMVITQAERFGISQLHQLRGRVGRGGHASICFLMTATPDQAALERLEAVAATTSGFDLADIDLRHRQEGDILGAAQSGKSRLKILNLLADQDIIAMGQDDAADLVARHPDLARTLVSDIEEESQDFLEKN